MRWRAALRWCGDGGKGNPLRRRCHQWPVAAGGRKPDGGRNRGGRQWLRCLCGPLRAGGGLGAQRPSHVQAAPAVPVERVLGADPMRVDVRLTDATVEKELILIEQRLQRHGMLASGAWTPTSVDGVEVLSVEGTGRTAV